MSEKEKREKPNLFRFVEKLEKDRKEYNRTKNIISFLKGEDLKGKKK